MKQTIAYLFLIALLASAPGGAAFAGGDPDVDPPLAPLPPVPEPLDNRITAAKAELGKLLFFDPKLTGDASLSCADCHNPKMGWGTDDPLRIGNSRLQIGQVVCVLFPVSFVPKRQSHLDHNL